MMRTRLRLPRVLLAASCVAAPALAAVPPGLGESIDSSGVDINHHAMPPPDVTKPPAASAGANPLWATPLTALSVTRDRPLFTPSRRPPMPIVANMPAAESTRPLAPPTNPPEHLNLALVGTVSAENKGVAVFIDPSTHDPVRLRTGEGHLGWILQSVDRRTATLQKSGQRETLELPQPTNPSGPLPVVTTLPPPPPIPPQITVPVADQHRGCPQELFGCRMHTE